MSGKRSKKAGKKAGRPVEPGSLRQVGGRLELRIPTADLQRYHELAGEEGLSAVIRRLLSAWAEGQ